MNFSKFWETVEGRGAWHATVHGVTKSWIQLSDLITTATTIYIYTHIYTYVYNLRYAYDTTLMAESEELKSLLKVKEESEKVGLKLNDHGIWSQHFMANRWGNSGNGDRLFWRGERAPKSLKIVTVAMKLKGACSLEEKL